MKEIDPTTSPKQKARQLFRKAYRAQMRGALEEALGLYRASIDTFPTAEAYTFLGWTHSYQKDYEAAMDCCRTAIAIDPEFGNPYNDIGAYLIELGRWDEAESWLWAATRAHRYMSYHFPLYNLGRLHEHRYDWDGAERLYRLALRCEPRYALARHALRQIQVRGN
ncbi:MAG: tetratricopeptide repeat protein [Candidatus Eisenbacteria bacterium]|nr:tetratricopeptide repeat protein [Candidatus Eisenbacteria bacterium]MCC7142371.1 tetratricopeptide repeat protein [Candidatus Eisenbacteria bacterium]